MRYDISKLLKKRLEKGLSQADVARGIGMSQSMVHYVEKGAQNPKTIKKMAEFLKIRMEDLVIEKDTPVGSRRSA